MSTLSIILAVPVSIWAVWFVIESIRYITSGEYEIDKRLKVVCR